MKGQRGATKNSEGASRDPKRITQVNHPIQRAPAKITVLQWKETMTETIGLGGQWKREGMELNPTREGKTPLVT
ncbi:hypothetical protein F2Q69_00061481 [Brassica cretica]|uniref:Uncharacterized protein n=1 Tax=Brassica cretica TaxID=69181 RepID=A0A8S9RCK7_BRACR|nr:hypothetical protein F2Q69_00061481 [Brassica cretica]